MIFCRAKTPNCACIYINRCPYSNYGLKQSCQNYFEFVLYSGVECGFYSVNVYDVIHHYFRAFQLRYECHTLDMCPVFFGSTGSTMKHRKVDK